MSFDLGVWFPHKSLTDQEAGETYVRLCGGDSAGLRPHPALDAFYTDLTARYPEIDTIPEDRIDDHDYCPWSCALDRSPAFIVMPCVWSQAENVYRCVHDLARKHGLAVYDPQSGRITYPDAQAGLSASRRAWWRLW
jgi:hypothetical protein